MTIQNHVTQVRRKTQNVENWTIRDPHFVSRPAGSQKCTHSFFQSVCPLYKLFLLFLLKVCASFWNSTCHRLHGDAHLKNQKLREAYEMTEGGYLIREINRKTSGRNQMNKRDE